MKGGREVNVEMENKELEIRKYETWERKKSLRKAEKYHHEKRKMEIIKIDGK